MKTLAEPSALSVEVKKFVLLEGILQICVPHGANSIRSLASKAHTISACWVAYLRHDYINVSCLKWSLSAELSVCNILFTQALPC